MGDRLDHRADLYSLGAVAYAAFTGQAPHGVISLGAVMQIDTPPPSMTTLREDVPDAIDVVVRRALEPDRDKRWPDLDSFLNALREAHATGKIPAGLIPADGAAVPAGPWRSRPGDRRTAAECRDRVRARAGDVAAHRLQALCPWPGDRRRRSPCCWPPAAGTAATSCVLSRPVDGGRGAAVGGGAARLGRRSRPGRKGPALLVSDEHQRTGRATRRRARVSTWSVMTGASGADSCPPRGRTPAVRLDGGQVTGERPDNVVDLPLQLRGPLESRARGRAATRQRARDAGTARIQVRRRQPAASRRLDRRCDSVEYTP